MVELLAWYSMAASSRSPDNNICSDPEDESYAQVHINLSHPIKLSRIAMTQLAAENRKGVILPFGSVGGIAGLYNSPIYIGECFC